MNEIHSEDLDFLAFRYVAGELFAAEFDSFEQRLADDQAAREAVARAVDFAQAVAATPADVIPFPAIQQTESFDRKSALGTQYSVRGTRESSSRRLLGPARWAAVAAAVVLGIGGWWYLNLSTDEESRLAKVWAEMLDSAPQELIADSEEPAVDDDADLTVPGWMLEAVGGDPDSDKWEDS